MQETAQFGIDTIMFGARAIYNYFLIQETAQFGIDTTMFGAGAGGFGAFTQAPGITTNCNLKDNRKLC